MHRNSLIEILRTFTAEENKKFNDFVKSPYFNKKSTVTKLWDVIKKCSPGFTDEELKRETVWKNLFPDKEFNYGVMKNLIWDLQKLAERFIELEVYSLKKFEQKNNLLTGLLNKELTAQFEKNLKSVKSEINKSADIDFYYYKYLFEAKEQNYFNHYRKIKEPGFCNSAPMNEYLTSNYFMKLFSENYNSLLLSKFYSKPFDSYFILEAFKFFENSLSKDDENVLAMYFTLKILMNTDDDESYNLLKKLMTENVKKFNPVMSYNLGMSLIGYCSYNLMNGRMEFVKDQFEICRLLIENNLHNPEDLKSISGSFFVKAVNAASAVYEFDWADKFIENFKDKLQTENKEHFLLMSLITLNIKRKNFDAALSYLSKAETKELVQKVSIRRYQIMIYYELGYTEELYSLIDTAKHFISNDVKTSEAVKKTFFNFVSIVLKLINLRSDISKKERKYELENLKNEILRSESTNKIWLMEKIEEIVKS